MTLSILERLLVPDRPRRKMHEVGEFSAPVSLRHPVVESDGPWVGTLSSGRFVKTRPSAREPDAVLTAFVQCPMANEDELVYNLFSDLSKASSEEGWDNMASTLEEGVRKLRAKGLEPKAITIPFSAIKEVTGEDLSEEDADKVSLVKGCVAEVQGIKIISARKALPPKTALITTVPPLTGAYIRVLDRVTVLLHRADTVILVQ